MKKYFFFYIFFVFCIDLLGQNIPVTIQGKPLSQVPEKLVLGDDDVILIAENGIWRKVKGKTARKYNAPYIAQNAIGYLPTATGNTLNLNTIFVSSIDGKKYYIDPSGSATELSSGGGGKTYLAGKGITITSSNVINSKDSSATNELQTLNLAGSQLSISGGNSVNLPSFNLNLQQVTDVGNKTTNGVEVVSGTTTYASMNVANLPFINRTVGSVNATTKQGSSTGIVSMTGDDITFIDNGSATILGNITRPPNSGAININLPTENGTVITKINGQSPDATGNINLPATTDTNIGNTDLSLTTDRDLDLNGKSLVITDYDLNTYSELTLSADIVSIYPRSTAAQQGAVNIGSITPNHSLIIRTGQNIDPTGKVLKAVDNVGKVQWGDIPTFDNLATANLSQTWGQDRTYTTNNRDLTFQAGSAINSATMRIKDFGYFNTDGVSYLQFLPKKAITIASLDTVNVVGQPALSGVNIGNSQPNNIVRINDGTANISGKFLKAVDNSGRVRWENVPTPPSGISQVTANEGLTSSVINGNPNIQLGGNPLAVGVSNERGFNMGDAGSLVFRDIQNDVNPVRDVIVITNDTNPIDSQDGEAIGIKYDIADNISSIRADDNTFKISSNKSIQIIKDFVSGQGGSNISFGNSSFVINNTTPAGISKVYNFNGSNVVFQPYDNARNDAGSPVSIASFGPAGELERHLVSELGIPDYTKPYTNFVIFDDFLGFKEDLTAGNIGQLDWKITTSNGGKVGNTNFTLNTSTVFKNDIGFLELKCGTTASGIAKIEMPKMLYSFNQSTSPRIGDKFRCRIKLLDPLSNTDVAIGFKHLDAFGIYRGLWVTSSEIKGVGTNGLPLSATLLNGQLFPSGANNGNYDVEVWAEETGTTRTGYVMVNGVLRGTLYNLGGELETATIEHNSTVNNSDSNRKILVDYFNLQLSNPVIR